MRNLSDFIEQYLRDKLSEQEQIELQRRELAKMFRCVPSQINYVLETRFTFDRGYLVESKRGGGGYIRITQVPLHEELTLPKFLEQNIPAMLSEAETKGLLELLIQRGIIDNFEAQLCVEVLQRYFRELTLLDDDAAGILRSKVVKSVLLVELTSNNE